MTIDNLQAVTQPYPLTTTYEIPEPKPSQYLVGFSGAHRSGKTTTAIEVAKKLDVEYINANVRNSVEVWTSFSPSDYMTFGERIQVQEFILNDMERLLEKNRLDRFSSFIIDRTPIDILAYLLTNIDNTTSSIFDSRGQDLIERCLDLSSKYFTHFVVIPASIPFVRGDNKSGKVYDSRMYQESLTNMIAGTYYRYIERMSSENRKTLIIVPDELVDLSMRVDFIMTSLKFTIWQN
jgi:AAA+ ATPase superfamily predicted ATPase